MARKTMTKEVTKTTVKVAKMKSENGMPVAEPMEDQILIGNVSADKAQKEMTKKHGAGVTVFEVIPETKKYKMDVETFIDLAEEVQEDEEEDQDEQ